MTESAHFWYLSDSTLQELSNEYQHNSVLFIFNIIFSFVPWTKVASEWKGLSVHVPFDTYAATFNTFNAEATFVKVTRMLNRNVVTFFAAVSINGLIHTQPVHSWMPV